MEKITYREVHDLAKEYYEGASSDEVENLHYAIIRFLESKDIKLYWDFT